MLFAVMLAVTSCAIAAAFAVRRWWFPLALNAHALEFDRWFSWNLAVAGFVFLGVQLVLAWVVLRRRDRGQRAASFDGSLRLELLWTAVTAGVLIGAAAAGTTLWSAVHLDRRPGDIRIQAGAKQFAWNFRYAGPDGRFGRTDVGKINDAAGNPFGVDERDPAGRDDIVSAALRIPAGRRIELQLTGQDVIHSFFVRELRLKQDVVPGMEIPLRFEAGRPGEYEIACAELCGLGHHQMRSVLIVLPPAEFDAWLRTQNR